MQTFQKIFKWLTLAFISLVACVLVLFIIFLIMQIFGVSDEETSEILDHRILLILLVFASMVISYFYLYKR